MSQRKAVHRLRDVNRCKTEAEHVTFHVIIDNITPQQALEFEETAIQNFDGIFAGYTMVNKYIGRPASAHRMVHK